MSASKNPLADICFFVHANPENNNYLCFYAGRSGYEILITLWPHLVAQKISNGEWVFLVDGFGVHCHAPSHSAGVYPKGHLRQRAGVAKQHIPRTWLRRSLRTHDV